MASAASSVPGLHTLHLHAEFDGDEVMLQFTTVDCSKRGEFGAEVEELKDLLKRCPGPFSAERPILQCSFDDDQQKQFLTRLKMELRKRKRKQKSFVDLDEHRGLKEQGILVNDRFGEVLDRDSLSQLGAERFPLTAWWDTYELLKDLLKRCPGPFFAQRPILQCSFDDDQEKQFLTRLKEELQRRKREKKSFVDLDEHRGLKEQGIVVNDQFGEVLGSDSLSQLGAERFPLTAWWASHEHLDGMPQPVQKVEATPGHWRLVILPVTVQHGEPTSLVGASSPTVSKAQNKPPLLRAVTTQSRNSAAQIVQWFAKETRKQRIFKLHCVSDLAAHLSSFSPCCSPSKEGARVPLGTLKRLAKRLANEQGLEQDIPKNQKPNKKPRVADASDIIAQGQPGHHVPICKRSWRAGDPNLPFSGDAIGTDAISKNHNMLQD